MFAILFLDSNKSRDFALVGFGSTVMDRFWNQFNYGPYWKDDGPLLDPSFNNNGPIRS